MFHIFHAVFPKFKLGEHGPYFFVQTFISRRLVPWFTWRAVQTCFWCWYHLPSLTIWCLKHCAGSFGFLSLAANWRDAVAFFFFLPLLFTSVKGSLVPRDKMLCWDIFLPSAVWWQHKNWSSVSFSTSAICIWYISIVINSNVYMIKLQNKQTATTVS